MKKYITVLMLLAFSVAPILADKPAPPPTYCECIGIGIPTPGGTSVKTLNSANPPLQKSWQGNNGGIFILIKIRFAWLLIYGF